MCGIASTGRSYDVGKIKKFCRPWKYFFEPIKKSSSPFCKGILYTLCIQNSFAKWRSGFFNRLEKIFSGPTKILKFSHVIRSTSTRDSTHLEHLERSHSGVPPFWVQKLPVFLIFLEGNSYITMLFFLYLTPNLDDNSSDSQNLLKFYSNLLKFTQIYPKLSTPD